MSEQSSDSEPRPVESAEVAPVKGAVSIRRSLGWLVAATLLPALLFGAIVGVINVRQERAAIEERLTQQARALSLAVDERLRASVTTLQSLAISPLLDAPDLKGFYQLADDVRRTAHPEWNGVGLFTPSGETVLSTLVPLGTPLPSYANHPAFREVLTAQRPVVTDLGPGRLTGRPSFAILVPAIRDREIRYVVAASLPAEVVSDFVGHVTLSEGWSIHVLDRELVTIARVPASAQAVGQAALQGFLAQTRAVSEGWWRFTTPDGGVLYTAYVRSPRLGWTTGIAVPAAVVEGPARQALWTVGGGTLAFLLLGLGLAVLFARVIRKPLVALANDARRGDHAGPRVQTGYAEIDAVREALRRAAVDRASNEAALRESEARFRTTLASIGDGVISTDIRGRVTYLNPVAERLTWWPLAEATGQAITDVFPIVHESSGQPAENPIDRVMAEGTVVALEKDILLASRSGREVPIAGSVARLMTPGGGITGAVFVFQDVGAERAAAAQFRTIADSAPVLIMLSDSEGLATFFNKPWLEFTGRAMADEVGDGWIQGVHPDDAQMLIDASRTAVEARTPFTLEYRLRRHDGTYRWILHRSVPRHEPDDTFVGAIGSCIDITERREAEETRRYLTAAVEGSDDAIVTKTLDGIITSWNPGAARMFGYTPEEAVGQPITLIIPPDRILEEAGVLARVRRGESVDHFETVRRRKDGTRLDISLTISPIRGPDDRIIGASKIARDVTEAKRLEADRDALLARERVARADAEAANRAKDEFLATLSHELRTPLSAILGWAQVIGGGQQRDAGTVAQALESIRRNAQLQVQLIDDLLDLSRIVAGKVRLESRTVDVGPVVLAAVDTIRPTAETKGIEIEVHLEAGTSLILGDPARLQQIFWNLLSNAVKFTPRDGRVHIRADRMESRVQIRISDTGQGIVADVLPFIFDRFRQGDGGMGRSHGGLGLGLAIVRHLVELHGGTVQAQSVGIGQGAVFTVAFPLLPIRATETMLRSDRTEPFSGTRCDGIKVLLVDDEADARALLAKFLELCGAVPTTVGSVAEALALLDVDRFDVIVSDLAMPGEDGFQLAHRVRERAAAEGGQTPLLALTAHAGVQMRIQAIQAGFHSYVAKPVDPDELAALVFQLARGGLLATG